MRPISIIGATFEDLNLIGPGNLVSGAPCKASPGFEFQNASSGCMERWTLRHIEMGGFCTGLHFRAPAGGGTASYGYGIVDGLWTNSCRQTALTLTGPVSASAFRETLTTPASSSAPCIPGQFTDDANFHYVCVAKNTWKRVAPGSF